SLSLFTAGDKAIRRLNGNPPLRCGERPMRLWVTPRTAMAQWLPAPSLSEHQEPNRERTIRNPGDDLATVDPVFPLGGPLARPHLAGGGDCDRARDRRDQCPAQSVEQRVLQRAAGPQLGRVRLSARLFLCLGGDLHRPRGLSALSQPVAPDPLAQLDDEVLSGSLA